jgi:MYXO-CTERM domain-containing protein
MRISKNKLWIVPAVASALLGSRPASACGGTFCASGPTAMPIDQTGENVLFVMDGQSVEAHVQIQYTGAAEQFAWVVPMPAIPEVTVGSQPLFNALLASTVPSYGFFSSFDQCGAGGSINIGSGGVGGSAGAGGSGGGSDAGGPTVVYKKTVGAFQVTVLQGGTAQEVSTWLSTNNYQSIVTAPAILQDYVAQNFVFAAIKLNGGAGIDEIHPLVFTYQGNEPCVPLKLTAVAAVQDMGVRVFFLGDDRVFPANYMHLELNPVRIDWQSFATNYSRVVSRAADSAVANGKAFVTEYAGPSATLGVSSFFNPVWSEAPFATMLPENVIDELTRQALASCFPQACQFSHPLVLPLLQEYLPAPAAVDEAMFYANLRLYALQIDRTKWQPALFAADFKARIVDPGRHARDIVNRWPYLTRMFTTISPAEMTLDPTFHARPDLSNEQILPSQTATRRTTCSGQSAMILPDNREVALPTGSGWPIFSSAMPWVETIEEVPATGAVITLVDNTALIDEQLALWNASQGWPPPGGTGGQGGALGGTQGGAAGSGGIGGAGGRGGAGGNAASGGTNPAASDTEAGGGCACGVANQSGEATFWLTASAVALGLMRRRQRRAQRVHGKT